MDALLLIFACFGLGALVARVAAPPAALVRAIDWWVIAIALPALVLAVIPRLQPGAQLWFPIAAMWLVFLGAWALAAGLGALLGWSARRIGAVTLLAGFGNTAFLGYPLIESLRGREALALAAVADQAGCFVLVTTGGVLVSALYSGGTVAPGAILRRIVAFPPFLALLGGVAASALGGWPPALDSVLHRLGATLTPLALFAVGLRLRLRLDGPQLGATATALGWKLALAPALVYALGMGAGIAGPVLAVSVLQAAMAPMVTAAILATQHDLEPPLASGILGAGILLSLFSVPLVHVLLP